MAPSSTQPCSPPPPLATVHRIGTQALPTTQLTVRTAAVLSALYPPPRSPIPYAFEPSIAQTKPHTQNISHQRTSATLYSPHSRSARSAFLSCSSDSTPRYLSRLAYDAPRVIRAECFLLLSAPTFSPLLFLFFSFLLYKHSMTIPNSPARKSPHATCHLYTYTSSLKNRTALLLWSGSCAKPAVCMVAPRTAWVTT